MTPSQRRECEAFCQYLARRAPTPYVVDVWRQAHEGGILAGRAPSTRFDAWLLCFARLGRTCARLADTYAVLCYRGSLLRVKLVVLLAILETTGATWRDLDQADGSSRISFCARAGLRLVAFGLRAGVVLLVASPVRLVAWLSPAPRTQKSP